MSDKKISRTILQYKELPQLQEFCEAQNTTILNLSKKNQGLEEKVKHLEEILKTTVPTISGAPGAVEIAEDDSEYICLVEIAKLKRFTSERELTLEESRRFDTYYKILNNIKSKPNNNEKEVKETATNDLLKLVESKDDTK